MHVRRRPLLTLTTGQRCTSRRSMEAQALQVEIIHELCGSRCGDGHRRARGTLDFFALTVIPMTLLRRTYAHTRTHTHESVQVIRALRLGTSSTSPIAHCSLKSAADTARMTSHLVPRLATPKRTQLASLAVLILEAIFHPTQGRQNRLIYRNPRTACNSAPQVHTDYVMSYGDVSDLVSAPHSQTANSVGPQFSMLCPECQQSD